MARSKLSDVNFQSSAFASTMQTAITHKLGILNGMMVEAPDEIVSPQSKGYTVSIPKFNRLSGTWQVISTSLTTSYNSLADYLDIGVWCEREIAFQAEQILKTVAGNDKDVTLAVAQMLGDFVAQALNASGMSVLTGIFATELATSHNYGDGSAKISAPLIVAGKQKLGDNADRLTNIILNSKVMADAVTDRLTYDVRGLSVQDSGSITSLLGMNPFQTDLLVPSGTTYYSYMCEPGAMIYKFRERPPMAYTNANIIKVGNIDLELVRDSETAGGLDGLIIRYSGLVHVPGVQWDGTVASNPTEAQLATGTSWTKVAPDDKLIPIVQLSTL